MFAYNNNAFFETALFSQNKDLLIAHLRIRAVTVCVCTPQSNQTANDGCIHTGASNILSLELADAFLSDIIQNPNPF